MKRIWFAIAAFVFIISLCVIENNIVNNTISEIQENLTLAQDFIKNDDIENTSLYTQKVNDVWENNIKKVAMLISHDQLEDINISISLLSTFLEGNEYNDFLEESTRISTHLENLKDTEMPTLSNIL